MTDAFSDYQPGLSDPSDTWATITPSDDEELSPIPRALHFGSAGDVVLTDKDGNDATIAVLAGEVLPLRARKVKDSGTTEALKITALY